MPETGTSSELFGEVFDRLRETEAQTREQCVQIKSLCDRISNLASITDRFFELEEKRHDEDSVRIKQLLDHTDGMAVRAEKRDQIFWKIISILLGTVVVLAVGPKVAKEVFGTFASTNNQVVYQCDLWHGDNDRKHWPIAPLKRQWPLV